MSTVVAAVGLVLVIEGLAYALAPGQLKRMMRLMQDMPDEQLRFTGLIAATAGLALAWLAKLVF